MTPIFRSVSDVQDELATERGANIRIEASPSEWLNLIPLSSGVEQALPFIYHAQQVSFQSTLPDFQSILISTTKITLLPLLTAPSPRLLGSICPSTPSKTTATGAAAPPHHRQMGRTNNTFCFSSQRDKRSANQSCC